MTAVSPVTKAARQAQIADILSRVRVRSQEELADLLAQRGVRVTQATLSRDLEELGAVRLRGAGGTLVYALPGDPGGPGSRPGGLPGPPAEEPPADGPPASSGPRGGWPGAWFAGRADEGASGALARVGPELSCRPRRARTWWCCAPRRGRPSSSPPPSTMPAGRPSSARSRATTPSW